MIWSEFFSKTLVGVIFYHSEIKSKESIVAFFKLVAFLCPTDSYIKEILYINKSSIENFLLDYIENHLNYDKGISFIKKIIDAFYAIGSAEKREEIINSKVACNIVLIFDLFVEMGIFDNNISSYKFFDFAILRGFAEDNFDEERIKYFVNFEYNVGKKVVFCSQRKSFPYVFWNECTDNDTYFLKSGEKFANEYFTRKIIKEKKLFSRDFRDILSEISYFISEFLTKDIIFRNRSSEITAIRRVIIDKLEEKYEVTWPNEDEIFQFYLKNLNFEIFHNNEGSAEKNFFSFEDSCISDYNLSIQIARKLKEKFLQNSKNTIFSFAQISSATKINFHNCSLKNAFLSSGVDLNKIHCESFGTNKVFDVFSKDSRYENLITILNIIKNLSLNLQISYKTCRDIF